MRGQDAVIDRREVHPLLRQQAPSKGKALGRIVVAADEKDWDLLPGQGGEKPVQQGHRLGWRQGAVVDIASNEHGIRPLLPGDIQDLVQNVLLVLQQGDVVEPLADVQVAQVQEFHSDTLLSLLSAGRRNSCAGLPSTSTNSPGQKPSSW